MTTTLHFEYLIIAAILSKDKQGKVATLTDIMSYFDAADRSYPPLDLLNNQIDNLIKQGHLQYGDSKFRFSENGLKFFSEIENIVKGKNPPTFGSYMNEFKEAMLAKGYVPIFQMRESLNYVSQSSYDQAIRDYYIWFLKEQTKYNEKIKNEKRKNRTTNFIEFVKWLFK